MVGSKTDRMLRPTSWRPFAGNGPCYGRPRSNLYSLSGGINPPRPSAPIATVTVRAPGAIPHLDLIEASPTLRFTLAPQNFVLDRQR